ncbi:MAG TPA: MarR family transcriptional regulator [Dehalococcoidia bacterium]|jgi:DNA-binding MarR family transcriptional regulator
MADEQQIPTVAGGATYRSLAQQKESARQYKEHYPWGDLSALEASLKVVSVYTAMMASLARTFNSIGVWKSFGRYSVLRTLFLGPGEKMNQAQLSKVLNVTSPNISYLVDSLEVEGLVERRPGEVDRRSTDVALTPAGRQLCEKLVPAAVQFSSDLLAGFSAEEKEQLNAFLERIQASAEALHAVEASASVR